MHLVDQIPIGVFHLVKALVAQDAGVVHQHVDTTEVVQCGLHDPVAVGHRVVIGHGSAAESPDLFYHLVRRRCAGALAVGAAAQVIDHHPRAMTSEQQRVGSTEAAASSGDYHHLIFETDGITHRQAPRGRLAMSTSVGQRHALHKGARPA